MKKFMRTILHVVCGTPFIGISIVPMVLGFLSGFVKRAFQAGLEHADSFIRWI